MLLQQAFDKGLSALQSGAAEQAFQVFSEIVQTAPQVPDAHFLKGMSLFQLQRYTEARKALRKAVELAPDYDDYWFNFAMVLKELKDWKATAQALRKVLALNPTLLEARAELLFVLKQQKDWDALYAEVSVLPLLESPDLVLYYIESAVRVNKVPAEGWVAFVKQVRERYPDLVGLAAQMGVLFLGVHKHEAAEWVLRWALALQPDNPTLLGHMGNVALQKKAYQEAYGFFKQALSFFPKDEFLRLNTVRAQVMGGLLEDLESHLNKDFEQPRFHTLLFDLAFQAYSQNEYQTAIVLFEHVQRYFPQRSGIDLYLAISYADEDRLEKSKAHYAAAIQKAKGKPQKQLFYRLMSAFVIPHIHASLEGLEQCFQRVENDLADLSEVYLEKTSRRIFFPSTAFLMAYHDYDLKPIMERLGRLWDIPDTLPLVSDGAVFKVGFVSEFFRNHSVSHYYFGLVEALCNDPRFEVTLVMSGRHSDALTERYRALADRVLDLHDVEQGREAIHALGLDALCYLDIGMSQNNYELACHRLGLMQMVFAGHPVTTGIPNMDYFVSHRGVESELAQAYYSEELVCLEHSVVVYEEPKLPAILKSKSDLGLDEAANNYLCPVTLFKLHPNFDTVIQQVLESDPQGKFYFFEYKKARWGEQLRKRFQRVMPELMERIVFLPWASQADFLQTVAQADVVLDTFYFGSGNLSYLTWGVGTPLVAFPGRHLRARTALEHAKLLGLEECLAQSESELASRAVKIAMDKPYQKALCQKIAARKSVLFGKTEGVEDFIHWLMALIPEKRSEWRAKTLLNASERNR